MGQQFRYIRQFRMQTQSWIKGIKIHDIKT